MYSTIIIFYISCAGIVGMLLMKRAELKNSKQFFLSRLAVNTDGIVRRVYENIRYVLSHINVHNGLVLVQWVAFHVISSIRGLLIQIKDLAHSHPHSKKVIDMINGKGDFHQNGGASFYLKRIGHGTKK